MDFLSETTEQGVTERGFALTVGDDRVPGIIWSPEGVTGSRPTILLGHGGTRHKRVDYILGLGRRFARHLGYNAVSIDAPGHGERITDPEAAEKARRDLLARITKGADAGIDPMGPDGAKRFAKLGAVGTRDWKAVLDALHSVDGIGDGPFGYWGLSMGTAIGLPFVSSEPRIVCAVLGLAGTTSDRPEALAAAKAITQPVLFIFQWDDELMTRESGLALFDAIGSPKKTMHINPGGHVQTPAFERDGYDAFFLRHLGPAPTA